MIAASLALGSVLHATNATAQVVGDRVQFTITNTMVNQPADDLHLTFSGTGTGFDVKEPIAADLCTGNNVSILSATEAYIQFTPADGIRGRGNAVPPGRDSLDCLTTCPRCRRSDLAWSAYSWEASASSSPLDAEARPLTPRTTQRTNGPRRSEIGSPFTGVE